MVEIRIPGDKLNIVVEKVNDSHRQRWPNAYKAFLEKREYRPDGFPLKAWPGCPNSLISALADRQVHTVEQFANMPDVTLPKHPEVRAMQVKAREFLTAQASGAEVAKLQHTIEQQTKRLSMQDDVIKRLQEQIDAIRAEQPERTVKRRRNVSTDGSAADSA